jgi:L-aspartate-alpha-decarboxylase
VRPLSHSHGGYDGLSLAWSAKRSKPQCELHYEGSCAIDENLLDAANICENEQVNNGERFITYAIKGERGSGMISVNGSAARRASVGDLLIIAAFAQVHEDQVPTHEPQLVFVDEKNQQVGLRHHVPTQAAPGHGTDEC